MGIGDIVSAIVNVICDATWVDWLLLSPVVLIALYYSGTRNFDHFRKRGVPHLEGLWPFFGNFGPILFGMESFSDFILNAYRKFEGCPMYGAFQFQSPALVLRDLDLIKAVTIKDFDHFTDHIPVFSQKLNPLLTQNLFSLDGQEWREMRATLSPAFTSSKMRTMYRLMDDCGKRTVQYIDKTISSSSDAVYERDMKDFFTRFANDCIATTAFGIQVDSLNDPDNEFYRNGYELTNTQGIRTVYAFLYSFIPKIMDFLGLTFIPNHTVEYFHRVVQSTMSERRKKGIFRPDMLQLLMQARAGELAEDKEDESEKDTLKASKKRLTDDDITAQAVVFFFAGFDTVSTLMCFTSLSLTHHPDVQQRLQREIDEVFDNHGGSLTYEALNDMKYLDMVLNEVMRMYSGEYLDRVCVKDYTFPAKNGVPSFTIRKGERICLPQHGIHHDPALWADPDKFDPERFNDENKAKIRPNSFFPFGIGPRICIGARFALMETKIALAHILRHFTFVATPKTPKTVKFAKLDFTLGIEGGFWMGFQRRQD